MAPRLATPLAGALPSKSTTWWDAYVPALAAPVARGLPAGSFAVAACLLPDDLAPDD
jgi:hypothetical protein